MRGIDIGMEIVFADERGSWRFQGLHRHLSLDDQN